MADTSNGLGLSLAVSTDTVDVANHVYNPLKTLDAQFLKGSDISSASSINISTADTGSYFHITGTTGITSITARNAGNIVCLRFAGVLTLTHNSTSLILPNGVNRTTAANDIMYFVSEGSGNWRCISTAPVRTEDIADNEVTLAKLSDGTQGGILYYAASGVPTELAAGTANYPLVTNGSSANPAYEQLSGTGIAAEAIDSDHYVDGSIDTAHVADNQITLAKQAHGTQGGIQYYAASGAPAELAAGTSGYFLKTQGGSANPVWAAAASGPSQADQAALEGETNEDTYAPPDLIKHSPGVAKFYVKADYAAGIQGTAYNVASVTDGGTGLITITIATDFSSINWAVTACTETPYTRSTNVSVPSGSGQTAGDCDFRVTDNNGTLSDGTYFHCIGMGDQ